MNIDFKITEILTLPATIMAALSLASGIVLFSPTEFLKQLFMLEFRQNNGFIIGIVFVVSISILIVNLVYIISKSVSNAKKRRSFYANATERLQKLNNYQKYSIYLLFIQDNRTFELPLNAGAIKELEQKFMIYKTTNTYLVSDPNNANWPYGLQPWVSDELNSKDDLLLEFRDAYEQQNTKQMSNRTTFW